MLYVFRVYGFIHVMFSFILVSDVSGILSLCVVFSYLYFCTFSSSFFMVDYVFIWSFLFYTEVGFEVSLIVVLCFI